LLTIHPTHIQQITAHLRACLPNEGCGLVIGNNSIAHEVIPITNILHSPFQFRMDPGELWSALQQIEAKNQALLAVYHSHPASDCQPSPSDMAEFLYPEALMLIISMSGAGEMKAFKIKDGGFEEYPLQLA